MEEASEGGYVRFWDAQMEVADMEHTIKLIRDELTAVTLERDALKREHAHMRTALQWLRDNWHPSHNHWDAKGTSGTNCTQCHSDTAARQAIRAGLCTPVAKEPT